MQLDVFNTHMELYPYQKDDYPALEDLYTAVDKFSQKEFPCGYMIEDGKLFLPRGTPISRIENMVKIKANIITESDPIISMSKKFTSLYDPRDMLQEESIRFLCENPNPQLALNLKTGLGKAQPISTRIPTPNGYRRMGDLRIGDRIFGSNGQQIRITGVFPQGVKDIYKVTFGDNRSALCCKEHFWSVKSHPAGIYRTESLECIMKDYKVYSEYLEMKNERDGDNRDIYNYKYYIPSLNGPIQYDHHDIPIDPYVIGAFIGNGCLSERYLTISCGDSIIPKKIGEICQFDVRRNSLKNFNYTFRDRRTGSLIPTQDFFSTIPSMINRQSYQKFIPDLYLYNSIDIRMELLRGLMDTDGSIGNGRYHYDVSYSSCSELLLNQIQEIIRGLGFNANITIDKREDKYRNKYHGILNFHIPHNFKKEMFTHPKKRYYAIKAHSPNGLIRRRYDTMKIKDIQLSHQEEAVCISVDASDRLYITEDFIVTHNTFTVAYSSTKISERALIITPNEGLKQQWIATYHKMFDYRPKHLINISGSSIMEAIMEDLIEPGDVYFVNHATLRSYMTNLNGYSLHKWFKKLSPGIKVYDESHMEFANILLIDFFSNTARTWYLTATFDRSDKTESACFKRAFNNVEAYGEIESQAVIKKHVIYHVVNINSRATFEQKAKIIGYQGMSSISYGKYAFNVEDANGSRLGDHNQTAYNAITKIVSKIKEKEGKILIFVPLIAAVDEIVIKLKKDHPDKKIMAYHSGVSKEDKETAEKKADIIVSTIKSTGTGKDIPGLRSVICAEPIASKVIAEQMVGRLRPYSKNVSTYFFDIVDVCLTPINWWLNARMKKIETLVKDVVYLDWNK